MRIVVVGNTGTIGSAVQSALLERGHEVVGLSRSSSPAIDLGDHDSIVAALAEVGEYDAIAVTAGSVPFKPVADLTRDDFATGLANKALGQIDVAQTAVTQLPDGGSITLVTGILADVPVATGAAASVANGAVESYVRAVAGSLGRGLRINVVSPSVLTESLPSYGPSFPGIESVDAARVAMAFVRAIEGVESGQIFRVL